MPEINVHRVTLSKHQSAIHVCGGPEAELWQAKISPVRTPLRVLLGYFDGDCLDLSVLLKSIFTPEIQKWLL